MKKTILFKRAICLLCGVALLYGCGAKLWPSEQGFPNREIVFVALEQVSSDLSSLGFIRPDGTGLITRTIVPDAWVGVPTWSLDGKFVAFRTEASWGGSYFSPLRPGMVSAEGDRSSVCREWERGFGRIWVTPDGSLLMPLHLGDEERGRIVMVDIHSCKELSTLYEATNDYDAERLDSATLSTQGWLAVNRILMQGYPVQPEVIVIEPDSNKTQIVAHGLAPAWSRDGEWLAYTALDGIYVVRKDGMQTRKIVDLDAASHREDTFGWSSGVPIASWSPDGEWLVYHRWTPDGAAIFKVNIESGIETEIFQRSIDPHWRWDKADIIDQ